MFGYMTANRDIMTDEQSARYKASYCGLCRALKMRRGSLSRLTLSYDMCFLILFLGSMYEHEESGGSERCIMHPAKLHDYFLTSVTDYAADMNVALAYLNFLDDWKDDRKVLKLAGAGVMSEEYGYIRLKYPEKCAFIEARLTELSDIEKRGDTDPDAAAHCFGRIMAEVFDFGLDSMWGQAIRDFAQSLGEFVYIMDAVCDLEGDVRHGRYNPLRTMYEQGRSDDDFRYILTMLIGDCSARFERLPLIRDTDIMRNVLYSGVWLRYNALIQKKNGQEAADE